MRSSLDRCLPIAQRRSIVKSQRPFGSSKARPRVTPFLKKEIATDTDPHHYGVIGAGFAGLAAVYHFLVQCSQGGRHAQVDVFDMHGIGGGASGVSAGLLHPYSPQGKPLWRAEEAMKAADEMIQTAEQFKEGDEIVCCRRGLLFEARTERQRRSFLKVEETEDLRKLTRTQASRKLPGLLFPTGSAHDDFYGIFLPTGCVLHSRIYMKNIWRACQSMADNSDGKLSLSLYRNRVLSCSELEAEHGPFDAIIVAAGAAVGCLPEMREKLPLRLCQGATLELGTKPINASHFTGPSLLGSIYLASDRDDRLTVGATREFDITPVQALHELQTNADQSWSASYFSATQSYLREKATQIWTPLSSWENVQLRTGVRALPPKTRLGALPVLRFMEPNIWVISGLGSRGVLYHSWLGSIAVAAILKGDPDILPR